MEHSGLHLEHNLYIIGKIVEHCSKAKLMGNFKSIASYIRNRPKPGIYQFVEYIYIHSYPSNLFPSNLINIHLV